MPRDISAFQSFTHNRTMRDSHTDCSSSDASPLASVIKTSHDPSLVKICNQLTSSV